MSNSIAKCETVILNVRSHCYRMTNRQDSATESVMNVNSIVKVNHTVKCEITLILNEKQTGFNN